MKVKHLTLLNQRKPVSRLSSPQMEMKRREQEDKTMSLNPDDLVKSPPIRHCEASRLGGTPPQSRFLTGYELTGLRSLSRAIKNEIASPSARNDERGTRSQRNASGLFRGIGFFTR